MRRGMTVNYYRIKCLRVLSRPRGARAKLPRLSAPPQQVPDRCGKVNWGEQKPVRGAYPIFIAI